MIRQPHNTAVIMNALIAYIKLISDDTLHAWNKYFIHSYPYLTYYISVIISQYNRSDDITVSDTNYVSSSSSIDSMTTFFDDNLDDFEMIRTC